MMGYEVTAQQEFDAKYISSSEICQRLDINRCTMFNGQKSGKLPAPIVIRRANGGVHIMLWLRAEAEPMMSEWAIAIASRKGE